MDLSAAVGMSVVCTVDRYVACMCMCRLLVVRDLSAEEEEARRRVDAKNTAPSVASEESEWAGGRGAQVKALLPCVLVCVCSRCVLAH